MLTLYTPGRGYPDLEVKLAYGLARVRIEAGYELVIILQNGFYQVDFETNSSEKINRTFQMMAERLLSCLRRTENINSIIAYNQSVQ